MMDEEWFYGIAVGGPKDGQALRSRSMFYYVPLPAKSSNPPSGSDYLNFVYRWQRGQWLPVA